MNCPKCHKPMKTESISSIDLKNRAYYKDTCKCGYIRARLNIGKDAISVGGQSGSLEEELEFMEWVKTFRRK